MKGALDELETEDPRQELEGKNNDPLHFDDEERILDRVAILDRYRMQFFQPNNKQS